MKACELSRGQARGAATRKPRPSSSHLIASSSTPAMPAPAAPGTSPVASPKAAAPDRSPRAICSSSRGQGAARTRGVNDLTDGSVSSRSLRRTARQQAEVSNSVSVPELPRRGPASFGVTKPQVWRPASNSPKRPSSPSPPQSSLARRARLKAAITSTAEDGEGGGGASPPNWCRWTPPASSASGGSFSYSNSHASAALTAALGGTRWTPPAAVSSSAADDAPGNLLCDADLHVQRYMMPRAEAPVIALSEETTFASASAGTACSSNFSGTSILNVEAEAAKQEAAKQELLHVSSSREETSVARDSVSTACSSNAVPDVKATGAKQETSESESPRVSRTRVLKHSKTAGASKTEAIPPRHRSSTWQAGDLFLPNDGVLDTVREVESPQVTHEHYNFKDKDSAVTSVIADNALQKSKQLIKELMSQGLWEDDDGPAFSCESSPAAPLSHRRSRSTPAKTQDIDGLAGYDDSMHSSSARAACDDDSIVASTPPEFLESERPFCGSDRQLSGATDSALHPDTWDEPTDLVADAEGASSLPGPSRSPSRMSTATTLEAALEGHNVPQEVLDEVTRLRRRICELEEHIRRSDVASLRASLQASPLALSSGRLPFSLSSGTGLFQDRDSLGSTQTPLSPTYWSDRTRITLSSQISTSSESCTSPKKAFMVRPPSTTASFGSCSSGGMRGGVMKNLSCNDLPPPIYDTQSPPTTARLSLRGRSFQGRPPVRSGASAQHPPARTVPTPAPDSQATQAAQAAASAEQGAAAAPSCREPQAPMPSTAASAPIPAWGSPTPIWGSTTPAPAGTSSATSVPLSPPAALSHREWAAPAPAFAVTAVPATAIARATAATRHTPRENHLAITPAAFAMSPQQYHRSLCATTRW